MAQPPNYGGPPSGPDPQRPYGQDPGWPPEGQGPPQYPPPGPGPGQPPPGGVPPPYPPPAGGPGGPGGPVPPGGHPYQYGPPGPPPRRRRTWLIVGVIGGAAVLVAAIVLLVLYLRDDESDPGTIEESTSEEATESPTEGPETTEPPPTDEAVGRCLPYEPQISGYSFDLSTPCDGDAAFWTVTAASDDVGATVDEQGMLTDLQAAYDVCGEEYGGFQLGEPWKDWFFTYDEATSNVEELYCVEAIGNPGPEGRLPVTPDTGDCFDDSDTWWTVPCDSDLAMYEVVDTVAVDPPKEMSNDEANEASAPCSGGQFFWQIMNVEGLTTAILCGDEL